MRQGRDPSDRPFPESWRRILHARMPDWTVLEPEERSRLEELIRLFLDEKLWEGAAGLALTDEIKVTISAHACLLVLALDPTLYRDVTSIIVYPTTATRRGERSLGDGVFTEGPAHLLGEARMHGPVMVAWDAVLRAGRRGTGRNVVHHEFAHKLDMLDGFADGMPPIRDRSLRKQFAEVTKRAFEDLSGGACRPFLDPYGATNRAEFFAVATELFFDGPARLRRERPDLYDSLRAYYRQDPARRSA